MRARVPNGTIIIITWFSFLLHSTNTHTHTRFNVCIRIASGPLGTARIITQGWLNALLLPMLGCNLNEQRRETRQQLSTGERHWMHLPRRAHCGFVCARLFCVLCYCSVHISKILIGTGAHTPDDINILYMNATALNGGVCCRRTGLALAGAIGKRTRIWSDKCIIIRQSCCFRRCRRTVALGAPLEMGEDWQKGVWHVHTSQQHWIKLDTRGVAVPIGYSNHTTPHALLVPSPTRSVGRSRARVNATGRFCRTWRNQR